LRRKHRANARQKEKEVKEMEEDFKLRIDEKTYASFNPYGNDYIVEKAVVFFAVMQERFKRKNQRAEKLQAQVKKLEKDNDNLEKRLSDANARCEKLEKALANRFVERVKKLEEETAAVNERLDEFEFFL
jgi:TolA-binding protein